MYINKHYKGNFVKFLKDRPNMLDVESSKGETVSSRNVFANFRSVYVRVIRQKLESLLEILSHLKTIRTENRNYNIQYNRYILDLKASLYMMLCRCFIMYFEFIFVSGNYTTYTSSGKYCVKIKIDESFNSAFMSLTPYLERIAAECFGDNSEYVKLDIKNFLYFLVDEFEDFRDICMILFYCDKILYNVKEVCFILIFPNSTVMNHVLSLYKNIKYEGGDYGNAKIFTHHKSGKIPIKYLLNRFFNLMPVILNNHNTLQYVDIIRESARYILAEIILNATLVAIEGITFYRYNSNKYDESCIAINDPKSYNNSYRIMSFAVKNADEEALNFLDYISHIIFSDKNTKLKCSVLNTDNTVKHCKVIFMNNSVHVCSSYFGNAELTRYCVNNSISFVVEYTTDRVFTISLCAQDSHDGPGRKDWSEIILTMLRLLPMVFKISRWNKKKWIKSTIEKLREKITDDEESCSILSQYTYIESKQRESGE